MFGLVPGVQGNLCRCLSNPPEGVPENMCRRSSSEGEPGDLPWTDPLKRTRDPVIDAPIIGRQPGHPLTDPVMDALTAIIARRVELPWAAHLKMNRGAAKDDPLKVSFGLTAVVEGTRTPSIVEKRRCSCCASVAFYFYNKT